MAHTWEFKAKAVELVIGGHNSVVHVARDVGVHPDTLRRWRKELREHPDNALPGTEYVKSHEELGRLRRDVQRLTQEISNKPATINGTSGTDVHVAIPAVAQIERVALNELVATLLGSRWLIAGIVFLLVLGGLGHVFLAQPIYRADALLEVEKTAKGLGTLADRVDVFEKRADVGGAMELLKSRRVLGEIVDNFKLDIVAQPLYFPLIGAAIARRSVYDSENEESSRSESRGLYPWIIQRFGFDEYAWGGESIEIEIFDIPTSYHGNTFTLVAGKNGSYQLLHPNVYLFANGVVGELEEIRLPDGEYLTLLLSNLRARPGTHFELTRKRRLERINTLKDSVMVEERGVESGFLQISLKGPDREEITAIINEIADVYVRQNLKRKSVEAEKTLNFLEQQLSPIKQQMESAETALNKYRLEQGFVDLPRQTQIILERIVSIEAQLSELNGSRQELTQKFKPQHPRIIALVAQTANLNGRLEALNSKVKRLPATHQKIVSLSRDVEVNTQLYTFLLNRAQELKVVKEGPVSDVRIADYAVTPYDPVWPNKKLLITAYLLLGVFLALAVAFWRSALRGKVEDPDVVEKQLGLPVYAIVPHSVKQKKLSKRIQRNDEKIVSILAAVDPNEPAVESLRALRTSLPLALLEAKNNVILITSPGPSVGKSFISCNLAAVLSGANNRVLLVEGDLRRGSLSGLFRTKRKAGLSDLIAGNLSIDLVVHETKIDKLWIIPAGTRPSNPSELLLHEGFASALQLISPQFDYVIIDSPPILAVTDAAIIGRLAGAALLVVKAGMHTLREIEYSAKLLRQAEVNLRGVVFNDMKVSTSVYGRYISYSSSYLNGK